MTFAYFTGNCKNKPLFSFNMNLKSIYYSVTYLTFAGVPIEEYYIV